mgnify:CR=1 FL=1
MRARALRDKSSEHVGWDRWSIASMELLLYLPADSAKSLILVLNVGLDELEGELVAAAAAE